MCAVVGPLSSREHSSNCLPERRCWSTTTQDWTWLLPVTRLHTGSVLCCRTRCQTGKRGQLHLHLEHCRLRNAITLKWRKKHWRVCLLSRSFTHIFFGQSFTLVTDHKPLLTLFGENKPISAQASARVQRWALTLAMYNYQIAFKPTAAHSNADGLSRLPLPEAPSEVPVPAELVLLIEHLLDAPVKAQEIRTWTRRDPLLSMVKQSIQNGWPAAVEPQLRPYWSRQFELTVQDGCIVWGSRVVVPTPGRQRVLQQLHEGHLGMARMKGLARMYMWWPRMDEEVSQVVRSCHECQKNQAAPPQAPLQPWGWPKQPWSRLHWDFAGPMLNHMFLVVVDAHTKWIEVVPMSNSTSFSTIQQLRTLFV